MTTIKTKIIAVSVVLGALLVPIAAQASPKSINHRLNHQQRRIDNGIRHGQLTGRETARLERREVALRHTEHFDRKHDHGLLTDGEHRRLERRENRLSHSIYRDKHNAHKSF